jgi:3-hydroxybutyryl-CoA dehydrogenase
MKTLGVIGAGTMGAGIAHIAALAGMDVILNDLSEESLQHALQRISSDLRTGVQKSKISAEQASQATKRIHCHTSYEHFSSCEIVIEAAIERLDIKKEIFKKLEAACSSNAIFASNTSSLSVTAIGSSVRNPGRVIGMHFFNPPHLMKLVEVIRGHNTSDSVVQQTLGLAKKLGKVSVIAKDTPGFIVNRIARPFYGEALRLLGEGVTSVEEIDRIVKLEGGFKMGPFELMDLIGIDVNFSVTRSMYEQTFGEPRYRPHVIQQTMVNAGLLGRKTKHGFYKYPS